VPYWWHLAAAGYQGKSSKYPVLGGAMKDVSAAVVRQAFSGASGPLTIRELVRRVQQTGVEATPGEIKGKIFSLVPDPVVVTPDFEYTLKEE
jgi:hypothetical protein